MIKGLPAVDGYIRKSPEWQDELKKLRTIIHTFDHLTEEVKWRVPCYTTGGKLVLFLGRFKPGAVLSFAKGSLLKDPKKILIQQTENSQSVRILRLSSVGEIEKIEKTLKDYIREAIENERAGKKVPMKKTSEFKMPEEFQAKLNSNARLKEAFVALTPGRQRGYLLYFAGAKQSKTREARVDKCTPQIIAGKGLDDD